MAMAARLDKAQAIVQHILRHISSPRLCPRGAEVTADKPLFVGISGPQGIGKTTITNKLVATLSSAPYNLRVITLSMDDLYLPFRDQEALRQKHPKNKLIEFRGLPGTHDVKLGTVTFRALCEANQIAYSRKMGHQEQKQEGELNHQTKKTLVAVPTYDKALNAGRGDQLPRDQWPLAQGPFDVVLFEGWSLGFRSVRDPEKLSEIYQTHSTFPPHYLGQHSFASVEMVNRSLGEYEREWYGFLDVFVHLSAPNLETVFKWRAEQERDLWAKKGTGMTEAQVCEFVSRFMPAYELYLERLKEENLFRGDSLASFVDVSSRSADPLAWKDRHLRVDLDENRELISSVLVE
ncbi:hypothetical protein BGX28_003960 [Mortierella sp. GBA30]|nr:hypothetical protein BGX28_003960 [Mortierella sp. GBA30]